MEGANTTSAVGEVGWLARLSGLLGGLRRGAHLDPDLEPRAAVVEHVAEVAAQAVVGPRLYGDADALGATPLRVLHRLLPAPDTGDVTSGHSRHS